MLIWVLSGSLVLFAGSIALVILLVTRTKKTEEFHSLRQELEKEGNGSGGEAADWKKPENIRQLQKNIRRFEEDDVRTRRLFSDNHIGLFSFFLELQDVRTGEKFATGIADHITIGRKPGCSLVFDRPTVSGNHCEIRVEGTSLELTDQQSRNGTFINGVRVMGRTRLTSGVILRLGQEEFLVTVSDFRRYHEDEND